MLVLLLQTSCDGKVASGTQVVFHEARLDPGLVTRLDRRHITGSTGGLLQSYTFLKCHVLLSILSINLQILLKFSCFSNGQSFSSITGVWMYLYDKGVSRPWPRGPPSTRVVLSRGWTTLTPGVPPALWKLFSAEEEGKLGSWPSRTGFQHSWYNSWTSYKMLNGQISF